MNQTLISVLIGVLSIFVMMYLLKMHMRKINCMLDTPKKACSCSKPKTPKTPTNNNDSTLTVSEVLKQMGVTQIN